MLPSMKPYSCHSWILKELKASHIVIYNDTQLVINQYSGSYQVKDSNKIYMSFKLRHSSQKYNQGGVSAQLSKFLDSKMTMLIVWLNRQQLESNISCSQFLLREWMHQQWTKKKPYLSKLKKSGWAQSFTISQMCLSWTIS